MNHKLGWQLKSTLGWQWQLKVRNTEIEKSPKDKAELW